MDSEDIKLLELEHTFSFTSREPGDMWHKRNIRGQSHFFWFFPHVKCFFPVEISILVDPKQISAVPESEKQTK